jgi:hypothetical protein
VSTRLLETTLNRFPVGTDDYVTHAVLKDYIQATAVKTGVHEITQYDTDVKNVSKNGKLWSVDTTTLLSDSCGNLTRSSTSTVSSDWYRTSWRLTRYQMFDAVVVASGHYHTPKIPNTPGLADWKRLWPDRVQHSKSYRSPGDAHGKVRSKSSSMFWMQLTGYRTSYLSVEVFRQLTSPASLDLLQTESIKVIGTEPLIFRPACSQRMVIESMKSYHMMHVLRWKAIR